MNPNAERLPGSSPSILQTSVLRLTPG
jgi:hypothetical protein